MAIPYLIFSQIRDSTPTLAFEPSNHSRSLRGIWRGGDCENSFWGAAGRSSSVTCVEAFSYDSRMLSISDYIGEWSDSPVVTEQVPAAVHCALTKALADIIEPKHGDRMTNLHWHLVILGSTLNI